MAKKILLVEDDVDVSHFIVEALAGHGHTVVTAANGAEALKVLGRDPLPSLILLDLMMPVMDGYRFLEELRQAPHLADIPIVILTASDRVDRRRIGNLPVVRKPFGLLRLVSLVEDC